MPIRDDSAGDYGTWNDDDISWLQWIKANASDGGNALANVVGHLTPIGTSPEGNMTLKVPNALTALAKASDPYRTEDDLSFRGAIAPAGTKTRGTYPGGASEEEFTLAWPEMITSPIESYRRMMDPENPRSFYHLTGDQELDADIQGDARNVLLSLYGGNALNPLAKAPSGSVGMFAGRKAKTADHAALAKAEQMAASGSTREQIWNDTGWFQGADDKWRFEIDDSNAAKSRWWNRGRFGKVLKHEDLSAAYPALADTYTKPLRGLDALTSRGDYKPYGSGWFSRWLDPAEIRYSRAVDDEDSISVLLHEGQHGIQQLEGFGRGATQSEFSYTADKNWDDIHKPTSRFAHAQTAARRFADEMMAHDGVSIERPDFRNAATNEDALRLMDEGFAWDKVRKDYEDRAYKTINDQAYRRSAGEAEARNVQYRQSMSAEERRAIPPWLTQDVPFERQFIQQYGQRSPLPRDAQKPVQAATHTADWLNGVSVPEYLPPAPVGFTSADALRRSFRKPDVIDAEFFSDTGKPSILGSAMAGSSADLPSQTAGGMASLDMSPQARNARAIEQGYTERAWRGQKFATDEIFPNLAWKDRGLFFADDPRVADHWARDFVNEVHTSKIPIPKTFLDTLLGRQRTRDYTWDTSPMPRRDGTAMYDTRINTEGFIDVDWPTVSGQPDYTELLHSIVDENPSAPGFAFRNIREPDVESKFKEFDPAFELPHTQYVVRDPSRVRSANAAFDPARVGENGLLLSDNLPSPLGSALATGVEDYDLPEWLRFK